MVQFPARRWLFVSSAPFPSSVADLLVDDFEGVALARANPRRAQERAQGTNVAPLPADDLTHVTFRDFQFDHVVVEMVNENLIGSVDDPLRNLLDESAHISSGFSHEIFYAAGAAGETGGLE
jgi:hypothetical protein